MHNTFSKKGKFYKKLPWNYTDLHIRKNDNLMLLNRIRLVIDPLLPKNQNGFRQNRSATGKISKTIRRIIEGAKSKQLSATLLFIDFSKAFDSIHRGKMREIFNAYSLQETVKAIMISYINTKCMVRSPDGDLQIVLI